MILHLSGTFKECFFQPQTTTSLDITSKEGYCSIPSPHVPCLATEGTKHPKVAACLSTASFKLLQIPVALHRLKQKAKSILGRKVLGLNACHNITGKSGLVKGGGQKTCWHTYSTQDWEEWGLLEGFPQVSPWLSGREHMLGV